MPGLDSIPPEIIGNIVSSNILTTIDYGNLRLTCKHVETSLFDPWSREFFSKKQFMITEFSLQALVDISKSRLSTRLNHVIFGLERPALDRGLCLLGDRPVAFENNRRQKYMDHITLLNTGRESLPFAHLPTRITYLCSGKDWKSRTRISLQEQ